MISIFKLNLKRVLFYKFLVIKSRTRKIINEFKLDDKIFYSWGMKRSGEYIRNNIKDNKLVFIEDGFVHSFGIKKKKIPLSICYDNNGIYYDFKSNNDLKEFFKEKLSKKNALRAKNIVKLENDRSKILDEKRRTARIQAETAARQRGEDIAATELAGKEAQEAIEDHGSDDEERLNNAKIEIS